MALRTARGAGMDTTGSLKAVHGPGARPWLRRSGMAVLGAAQGLLVWLLVEHWPRHGGTMGTLAAALQLLLVQGLVVHLCWTGGHRKRLWLLATAVALPYAAIGWWVGAQLPAAGHAGGDGMRAATWVAACGLSLYILMPWLQILQHSGRWQCDYRALCRHAWSNAHLVGLAAAFTLATWAALLLWAALMDVLGVAWFRQLLRQEPVIALVTGGAAGLGLALAREREDLVRGAHAALLATLRGLLPLVVALGAGFLLVLAVIGLEPLWGTGRAAWLLLGWSAGNLFLFNAAYGDGSEPPTGLGRRLSELAIPVTACFCALALWALALRIGQYSLTPLRIWGLVAALLLSSYAAGYVIALLRRLPPWLATVETVNRRLAWAVVATVLAMHTPMLDPLHLSADAQARRLLAGTVAVEDFDFCFLHRELGSAGQRALDRLAAASAHPQGEAIRQAVDEARGGACDRSTRPLPVLEMLDPKLPVPEGLAEAVRTDRGYITATQPLPVAALELDAAGDGPEYLVFWPNEAIGYGRAGDGWQALVRYRLRLGEGDDEASLPRRLRETELRTEPACWPALRIGAQRFEPFPQAPCTPAPTAP